MPDSLARSVASNEWNEEEPLPGTVADVPALLTHEERRMLVWVARHAPPGAIVELGSFLGGSTVALAHGVATSASPAREIYSFDQFKCPMPTLGRFISEEMLAKCVPTNNFRPVYDLHIAPFAANIKTVHGNILEESWDQPIALLFVDIMKTWEVSDYVVQTFFPHLEVGSIVVHQDYLYDRCPWIIFVMNQLSDCFELLGATEENSAIFRMTRRTTQHDIERALSPSFGPDGFVGAIDAAARAFDRPAQLSILASARQNVLDCPDVQYEGHYPRRPKP